MELHLNTFGSFIRKKDDMFEVSIEEKKVKLSPDKISSIVISNAVSITSDAIQLAMRHNIDIVFLDKYGNPYGRVWYPKLGSTTLIRRKQLMMYEDELGLQFIKERILIKVLNQYSFLKMLISKREAKANIYDDKLKRICEIAKNINNIRGTLDSVSMSMMGWEGGVSRIYFEILSELIPEDYRFEGRSSRPAKDAFNAFLNYGYGILYSKVERALIIAGLDPYLGLLHADNYAKKSFVFDFIEPYRIMIDEPVFYIFSRRKFQSSFIDPVHNGVCLSTEGKKFFAPLLIEHFSEVMRYHNKNRKRLDQIQTDAHAFANFLIEKRDYYLESSVAKRLDNFLRSDDSEDIPF